jgi:hypothetical protein
LLQLIDPEAPAAIRTHLGAIFVSLELSSKSTWLVTSLLPSGGERMSKHAVRGGDIAGLLARFAQLRERAQVRTGETFPMVVIQEAGLDGFWIHRVLEMRGSRAMLLTLPPLPPRAGDGGRRPIRSTAKPWCGHCLLINAASHAYARWRSHRRPKQRIGAGSAGSARSWSVSGRATPIASRGCYLRKG